MIDEVYTPIYGKYCWNAEKGYGSFLTFEFGNPRLIILEYVRSRNDIEQKRRSVYVHGDWHLWIYLCDWVITSTDGIQADSTSSTRMIKRAMAQLNGQALNRVSVQPDGKTFFEFDFFGRLETLPNPAEYGEESEQWLLYEPSGKVFVLRADMKYSHQSGSTKKKEEAWLPLPLDRT